MEDRGLVYSLVHCEGNPSSRLERIQAWRSVVCRSASSRDLQHVLLPWPGSLPATDVWWVVGPDGLNHLPTTVDGAPFNSLSTVSSLASPAVTAPFSMCYWARARRVWISVINSRVFVVDSFSYCHIAEKRCCFHGQDRKRHSSPHRAHTDSSSAIRLPRDPQALQAPSYRRIPKNQRTTSNVNGTPSSQRINPFPMMESPFLPG